jgi:putative zinc finger protein
MVCAQCQELLSEYIDGGLELGEQLGIERHLADCEPCRAVRDDLLQIVHFSQQLPLQSPSVSLWPRIESDLEQVKPGIWSRPVQWWNRLRSLNFNLSIPQMAAGAAAIVIIVSIGVIVARRDTSPTASQGDGRPIANQINPLSNNDLQQLEKQINQLSESVEQRKSSWDPEVRTAFEKNLYYVDQSLLECRHQLDANPSDDVSQELMLNAYREKVRLLAGFENF